MSDFDVIGVGNAMVDVLARVDEKTLAEHNLPKGVMSLVDGARAEALYDTMGPGVECSGGSASNTMAGVASFGGRPAFIGKVGADTLGRVFHHDITAAGVHFSTPALEIAETGTGRCMVMVTPDAERTMSTYLGAAVQLSPADIDPDLIARSRVTYLEGYLWDETNAKNAMREAAETARAANNKVALTLSDAFCVDRHRAEFRDLVAGPVNILFANESEIISLYETDTFDAAVAAVRGQCDIAVLTRGATGSVMVTSEGMHVEPSHPPGDLVDSTGAGDLYAAGFLFGYTRGQDLPECARLGALAAAEIISHYGARPEKPLKDLL